MVISPEHFLNELLGYQKTAALKAAIELDLFSALAAAEVPSRRWLELGWRSLRVVQPK